MTEYLVKRFIKEYKDTGKAKVRGAYGMLAGVVGICANLLLFLAKLFSGILTGSISIIADAFNNLSDMTSSLVSLLGLHMAKRPADEEHPFGHGRLEYITALVVSFIILQLGFILFKEGINKIKVPQGMRFSKLTVIILILSIFIKLWLSVFNRRLGKSIHSKVIEATAKDSMGDVIVTFGTLVALIFYNMTGKSIDGFIGVGVSLVVMWTGVTVAKDTISPLIGEAINYKDYERVTRFVESFNGVLGSHDLIIHQYGPEKNMASIHVEVSNRLSMEESHEIIDKVEREALEKLDLMLVIHTDPVETRDRIVLEARANVLKVIQDIDDCVSIHDFRLSYHGENINLIFDMIIPYEYTREKEDQIKKQVRARLKKKDKRYYCVITVDRSFVKGSAT